MSIFRSEDMNLLKLIMSKDQEYPIIDLIGQSEMAHFIDINGDEEVYNLPYVDMVRRCEESEKKVLSVISQCNKHDIALRRVRTVPQLTELAQAYAEERKTAVVGLFDLIEKEVGKTETFLNEQNDRSRQMKDEMNHLIEYYTVLKRAGQLIFGEEVKLDTKMNLGISKPDQPENLLLDARRGAGSESDNSDDYLFGNEVKQKYSSNQSMAEHGVAIAYMAGTINHTEQRAFEKLIFRASRGKVLTRFHEQSFKLTDFDGSERTKTVYVLVYQEGRQIRERVTRVCQGFQGKMFALPDDGQNGPEPFTKMIRELKQKVQSMYNLIEMTQKQMKEYLQGIQSIEEYPEVSTSMFYLQFLRREKTIFHCLNMLTRQGSIVHGYVWTPLSKEEFLEKFYGPEVSLISGQSVNSPRSFNLQVEQIRTDKLNPPTYFKTNEFTKYFQIVVDQYAVPSYKEINPAIYTIISFPFLFGVMYGDVGHGSVLLSIAVFLMLFGQRLVNSFESLKDLYEFRYMLFLMSFFSVYCGLMYNDFMSLPLNLFDSCYNPKTGIREDPDCVYPVGIDPIWYGTKQELIFLNSFKMKISVILAICHMTLGIVQKGFNAHYKKDWQVLFNEFVPQLILLLSIFGYMDVLILIKWNTNYAGHTQDAPSIIVTIVNFFLAGGSIKGQEFFTMNQFVSQILLLIALVTIPWMLLVNPYLQWDEDRKRKKARDVAGGDVELKYFKNDYQVFIDEKVPDVEGEAYGRQSQPLQTDEALMRVAGKQSGAHGGHGEGEEFDLMAVGIQSMIHTIEFALGTISNTASYLRLWALSLAHSQLAKVFFDMLLASSLESGSIIGLFIGFFCWASATLGVLLMMDVMEVMLHTVRLHWVEFMSKFFEGEGYAYTAFGFNAALEDV